MDTYSLLREIADSWVLLAMFLFFVGVVVWAFLPSQNAARADASMIPMRNDANAMQRAANQTSEAIEQQEEQAHV